MLSYAYCIKFSYFLRSLINFEQVALQGVSAYLKESLRISGTGKKGMEKLTTTCLSTALKSQGVRKS